MADDYTVPGGAGDVNEFTRRAQAAERNADRMREKDEQRRRSAEDTSRVERDSTRTRGELSRAAENLSTNIEASASAFARENEVLTANVRLLEQQLALRRSLASTPGVGRMARTRAEGSMAATPVIPAGAVEDPNAQRRLDDAIRRQAQVEARATQASGLYTASLRPGAATSGQSPELLAQRDELRARAGLARQETAAARENLQAQEAIVAARRTEQAELARQNEAIAAETRATVRAAAEAQAAQVARAGEAVGGRAPLMLPPGRGFQMGPIGSTGPGGLAVEREATGLPRYQAFPPVTTGGAASRTSLGLTGDVERGAVSAEAAQRMEAYRVATARALSNVERLEAGQVGANRAFQEAGVVYSNASLALSRHGALTTEFIQAFARGQVTLKEFESQMVSTIGKFGGWLVAGAAVYTVFEAFKHVTEGITQTQAAVQQLGRFLPGLGGPAGGGSSQIPAAETAVRDISQQFNVPIRDVVEPMQVMARTFHDVNNAAQATRAVLAVQRLDLVPGEQAERFLTGISNSLGFSSDRRGGAELVGVVNALNALQSTLGARVSETLPAVARAAPLAQAMGLNTPDLMALAAMGVRGGVTGSQVGTGLFRSMANFAFQESSLQTYQRMGLGDIQQGQYGTLMGRAMRGIDQGTIRPEQLRDLAVAIAGPQQARTIMPMLIQEMQRPGTYAEAQRTARAPRDYQEDLSRMVGTVSERFKSLGITLENFGSRLYSAGITAPVNALIDGISLTTRALTSLARPVSSVLDVFNQLPAVVRDAVGAFIAWQVGTRLYQSQFGATTRGFLSRLPTPFDISNRPADVAGGYADRLQRDLIPVAQREFDRASTQALSAGLAQQRLGARRDELAGLTPMMMGRAETDPERMRWARQLDQVSGREMAARATLAVAAEESAMAEQGLLRLQADYQLMKDKSLTFAERASIAEQRGTVATDATAATQEAIAVIKAETLAAARGEAAATRAVAGATAAGAGLWLPPGAGRGGGAGPAAAAAEMATAEAGFLTTRLRRLGSRMIESQDFPLAGPGVQALRLANTGMVAGAEGGLSRLAGFGNTLGAGMMAGIPGALGTAFQGIFAAQMLNAIAPGRVGDTLGQIGTAGALGAGGVQLARSVAERFGYTGTIGMGAGIGTAVGVGLMGRQDLPSQILGGGLTAGFAARLLGAGGATATGAGIVAAVGQGLQAWANSQNTGLATRAERNYGAPTVPEYGPLGFMRTQGDRNLWEWINPFHRPSVEVHQTQQAVERWRQNQANLRTAQQGGALSVGGIDQFGSSVSQAMDDAFNATGNTQKQAQAFLTSHMRSLSTSLQAFGGSSAAGRNSARLLQETVNQALSREAADPTNADQIQQLATQATQALSQSAQQEYQLAMVRARNATDRQAAYQQLVTAERQNIANEYTNALPQLQNQAVTLESRYNDLLRQRNAAAPGSDTRRNLTSRLNAVGDQIATVHNDINLRQAGAAQQSAQDAVTNQQNQAQNFSANQAGIQAQATVATAMAGANRQAQIRAQIAAQRAAIYNAQHNLTLSPEQQTNEIAQANAQIMQLRQQQVQQTLTERQAQQGVTEARIPSYDTVGQARQRLRDLTDNYNYMKAHPQAYDPADIAQALTAVITAKQGVTDAVAQYATQMGDIRAQLAEAQHIGDNVAQATDELNAAYNQLANARGPQAQAQARQRVLTAQNQRYSAVTSRQDAQYQLAQINATGDAAAQAHIQMAQASYDLSRARGPDERTAALQERAQAQVAEHQATQQQIAAYGQYRQALAQGDPMAQARIGVQTAQAILANARGVDEITAAQTQVAQAFWTQHEAYMASIQAQTDLAASRTREPMQQLQIQLRGAQRQLASARGPEERTRDQTQVNSLRNQITGQHISERESTVDFMLSMGQITTQQAVRMWEDIARTRGITKAERQQVLQRIHQAQMGDETQFDVGPAGANIKLPSVTDVMRSMRGAFTNATHPANVGMSDTSSTTVNVYVNDSADVPKVADALERATRAKLKSRMRAAGVRGI